jgi:hypothetical protein
MSDEHEVTVNVINGDTLVILVYHPISGEYIKTILYKVEV